MKNNVSISVKQVGFIVITLLFSLVLFASGIKFSNKFEKEYGSEKKYINGMLESELNSLTKDFRSFGMDTEAIDDTLEDYIDYIDRGWISLNNISSSISDVTKFTNKTIKSIEKQFDFSMPDEINDGLKSLKMYNFTLNFLETIIVLGVLATMVMYFFNQKGIIPILPIILTIYVIILFVAVSKLNTLFNADIKVVSVGFTSIFLCIASWATYGGWIYAYNIHTQNLDLGQIDTQQIMGNVNNVVAGVKSGVQTGVQTARQTYDANKNQQNMNQGYNSNMNQQNMNQGYNPNMNQQNMNQGYNPNMNQQNMNQGYNPNMNQQNMNQGYNPNMNQQNMNQGYNPNMNQNPQVQATKFCGGCGTNLTAEMNNCPNCGRAKS